jgi:hypothetical protein
VHQTAKAIGGNVFSTQQGELVLNERMLDEVHPTIADTHVASWPAH